MITDPDLKDTVTFLAESYDPQRMVLFSKDTQQFVNMLLTVCYHYLTFHRLSAFKVVERIVECVLDKHHDQRTGKC